MRVRSLVVGWAAVFMTLAAASAAPAPASPDEAAAIKAALERYVGAGRGGTSPVTVTPDGDHYTIAIDVKSALSALDAFGIALQPATYSFTATPAERGLWHVAHMVVPKLTITYGDQSYSTVVNGADFDGVFDPRIPGFQTSTFTYDSMGIATVGPRSDTQTREITQGRQTTMTTSTGDGTSSVQMNQTTAGFVQDIDAAAVGASAAPNARFTIKGASTAGSVAIDAMHSRALADLWAFLVAHPHKDAIKSAQEELRTILRQALPLFDRWVQSGDSERVTVASPYGTFAADAVGGRIKLSGLVAEGAAESELHVAGLSIPGGLLPGWSAGFVPTAASIAERFTGFHLDAAARQAVDGFDLTAKDPLKPELRDSIKASLGPVDQMVVTIMPSHVASKLLSVDFDGEVRLTAPVPDFHVNIRAAGIDAALQDLQARSAGDPSASQVAAVLVLAKGLGKTEADGRLSWAVTRNAAGDITVNGLTLPGSPHR